MRRWLPQDRLGRAFAAFVVANAVLIAVVGWQAVESQEVKGSLQSGSRTPTDVSGSPGDTVATSVDYRNVGGRSVTIEGAELLEATENLELVEVEVRTPGDGASHELEGYEVEPSAEVELTAIVRLTGGSEGSFRGLRLHYRAGGRAGLSP